MDVYPDIPAMRLRNLGLTTAPLERADEVVRRLVAVQAQDYYGAVWSLGQRMASARDADLNAAFDRGEILRTHLLRPTWHFVLPEDIRGLLALTAARVHQANGTMYRQLGLDERTLLRSDAALSAALESGAYLTRKELRIAIQAAGIDPGSGIRLAYLVMHAELEGVICSGPRRGKQFTYALLAERTPPAGRVPAREELLAELTRRYFESRGPASLDDFAKWSGLTKTEARTGLDSVGPDFERIEVDGRALWFRPGGPAPEPDPPRAFLLSIYDEYVSSYKDHDPIASAGMLAALSALDNALTAIIVLDGRIIGTWRRIIKTEVVTVMMHFIVTPDRAGLDAIREAAQRYAAFLGLDLRIED